MFRMQHEPRCPVSGAGEPRKGDYDGVEVVSPVERSQLSVVLETGSIAGVVVATAVATAVVVAVAVVVAGATTTTTTSVTTATTTTTTTVVVVFTIITVSLVNLVESCCYRRGCSAATASGPVVAIWQRERVAIRNGGSERERDRNRERGKLSRGKREIEAESEKEDENERERESEAEEIARHEELVVVQVARQKEEAEAVDHRVQRRRRRRWHECVERVVTPLLLPLPRESSFSVSTVPLVQALARFELAVWFADHRRDHRDPRDRGEGRLLQGDF